MQKLHRQLKKEIQIMSDNKQQPTPATVPAVTTENTFALQNTQTDAYKEELDGFELTFDRIKVPSGGGLVYELPGDNPDEPTIAKEFKAVVLYHRQERSYYKSEFDGKNESPDCASYDGKHGTDKETGEVTVCKECPLNEFGSGKNDSKACKTKRKVFLLLEGSPLPVILNIPTTSVKDFGAYISKMVIKYGSTARVVTKFALKRDTNAGGIVYSKVVVGFERLLTETELASVQPMVEQTKGMAKTMKKIDESGDE
jgi:hypothetical protein